MSRVRCHRRDSLLIHSLIQNFSAVVRLLPKLATLSVIKLIALHRYLTEVLKVGRSIRTVLFSVVQFCVELVVEPVVESAGDILHP